MHFQAGVKEKIGLLPYYGIACLAAAGLKSFYSHAGAENLDWILMPTVALAEFLMGVHFERELHTGWISHSHRMIVGPACAGVNFLIVAFSMMFFSFAHRLRGRASRAGWLAASLGGAYLLTIAANSLRIIAAIHLLDMDIYGGPITPARVHRVEGTVVYCLLLLLAHHSVEKALGRFIGRRPGLPPPVAVVPLGWYLAVVLGVPLLNRAYRGQGPRFLEHSVLVLSVCVFLILSGVALQAGARRIRKAPGSGGGRESSAGRC